MHNSMMIRKQGINIKKFGISKISARLCRAMSHSNWERCSSGLNDKIVKGIDGIYINMNKNSQFKYIIDEAKYGTSNLGKTMNGTQMSANWLTNANSQNNRILKAVGDPALANDIQRALRAGQVQLVKTNVDANGNVSGVIIQTTGGNIVVGGRFPK